MRSGAAWRSIVGMKIMRVTKARRRRRPAGTDLAETMSIAAQMALLCPSGMDVWMQRELAGCFERGTHGRNGR